jgi:hypothetical protein
LDNPRIAPLLNEPTGGRHRQDRTNRRAQQGNPELAVVQAQPVLNGRNACDPTAKHSAEEEKEPRRCPAGMTQMIGEVGAFANGNRFGSRNAGQLPHDIDVSPQFGGSDGSIRAHAARRFHRE